MTHTSLRCHSRLGALQALALLGVITLTLPASHAQPAVQLADVNTLFTGSSDPDAITRLLGLWEFEPLGSRYVFGADDGMHGHEPWITDGTPGGTHLIADICPGICDSLNHPFDTYFVTRGGQTYFIADDGIHGRELWATDGSAVGTQLVADSKPGLADYAAEMFFHRAGGAVNGRVFFAALDPTASDLRTTVWVSDGTAPGTLPLPGLPAGHQSARLVGTSATFALVEVVPSGGGRELWRTDGTALGTSLLLGTAFAPEVSAETMTELGGRLLFAASRPAEGRELWQSDGTVAGTAPLVDLQAGATGSSPAGLLRCDSRVFFSADTTGVGRELWRTDGTAPGTVLVGEAEIGGSGSDASPARCLGAEVLFFANTGDLGTEPWRSTPSGVELVLDVLPGTSSSVPPVFFAPAGPEQTGARGAAVLFWAHDGVTGRELWITDGTAAGTERLEDLAPGSASPWNERYGHTLHGATFASVPGATLFFAATPAANTALWSTDGTPGGAVLLAEINSATSSVRRHWGGFGPQLPEALWVSGNRVVFWANDRYPQQFNRSSVNSVPGTTGQEPWVTSGTPATTQQLADVRPGPLDSEVTALGRLPGGQAHFAANAGGSRFDLWRTDGTPGGTAPFLTNFGVPPVTPLWTGSRLFLATPFTPFGAANVLVSDGVTPGLVTDVANANNPTLLGRAGAIALFTDAGSSREVWRSDGTPGGTAPLTTPPAIVPTDLREIANAGPRAFFFASDPAAGRELWVSDGTAGGTSRVVDLNPGVGHGVEHLSAIDDPSRRELAAFGGRAVFSGDDGSSGAEPWVSDGTPGGTVRLRDVRAGATGSYPTHFTPAGRRMFFVADDGTSGRELWVTDGTVPGTLQVADIAPGGASSQPQDLTAVGALVVFSAHDGIAGRELWVSDGTPTGTVRVQDIAPGAAPASPHTFVLAATGLFFFAQDGVHGFEPWWLPLRDLPGYTVFADGFEAGNPSAWSAIVGGALRR